MSSKKPQYHRVSCPSCEILVINGVACHEHGCPTSYLYSRRECRNCGYDFEPEYQNHRFCSESCHAIYYGLDCSCDEERELVELLDDYDLI